MQDQPNLQEKERDDTLPGPRTRVDAFPTIGRDDMHDEKTAETAATAVIYMRVNEDATVSPEAAALRLERQRARCHEVANRHGLTVIAEYADRGGAVRLEHRPELKRLLHELPSKQAQYVIVGDIARLSRNARELVVIERRLMAVGAELLVWGENEVHAHLRRRMAAVLDEYEAGHGPTAQEDRA